MLYNIQKYLVNIYILYIFATSKKKLCLTSLIKEEMKKYEGKEEMINGQWYPVTVEANNIKEANQKLYVGQRKSYGTVEKIKGKWTIYEKL